jgi:hypothetical protein
LEMYVEVIQIVGDKSHGEARTATYPSGFFGVCVIAEGCWERIPPFCAFG